MFFSLSLMWYLHINTDYKLLGADVVKYFN